MPLEPDIVGFLFFIFSARITVNFRIRTATRYSGRESRWTYYFMNLTRITCYTLDRRSNTVILTIVFSDSFEPVIVY